MTHELRDAFELSFRYAFNPFNFIQKVPPIPFADGMTTSLGLQILPTRRVLRLFLCQVLLRMVAKEEIGFSPTKYMIFSHVWGNFCWSNMKGIAY
jgi:hypothetical protein